MEQKLETHQEALERLQLQIGDKVKIIEKAESSVRGWIVHWVKSMDKYVGKTGIITHIKDEGIGIKIKISAGPDKFDTWNYPAFVLEVVERASDLDPVTGENRTYFLSAEETISYSNPKLITVLQEAESLIYGDREKDYGKTSDNFKDIAKGWEVIAKTTITPEQVGLMMAWLKICRANKDNCEKRDSLIDLAGYAGCIEKIKKGL